MLAQHTNLVGRYLPVRSRLPVEVCDIIIEMMAVYLLDARRKRAFAASVSEDSTCWREELEWKATFLACSCVSRAWNLYCRNHVSQFLLSNCLWLSSRTQVSHFAKRLRCRSQAASTLLPGEVAIAPDGWDVWNHIPYLYYCVVAIFKHLPSAEKLSLRGVWWTVRDPRCMRALAMHTHITHLALIKVYFEQALHLRHLLEALPSLRSLECSHVSAGETKGFAPMMARCRRLRELKIIGFDTRIWTLFVNVEHGAEPPPIEVLSFVLPLQPILAFLLPESTHPSRLEWSGRGTNRF